MRKLPATPPYHSLSEAVASEGWKLEVRANLDTEDGLGTYSPDMVARACRGFILAILDDSWQWCYAAAHEIAEAQHGFDHSARMFAEQANILARWLIWKAPPRTQ